MSSLMVHGMATGWSSSAPALQVSVDAATTADGDGSNRLAATSGALGATATFQPPAPLDLSNFDEVRFWIRAGREAAGSSAKPFYLEFSFRDANDTPADDHRWFVPINEAGRWEQRRVGIEGERRSNVDRLQFRCLAPFPFTCHVDEVLAVRDEMLLDLEGALTTLVEQIRLAGLTDVGVSQFAAAGNTVVVLPLTPGFAGGNRVLIRGGSAGDELHDVSTVTNNPGLGTTVLTLDPAQPLAGSLTPGLATLSLLVPAVVDPASTAVNPALLLTLLEAREDADRGPFFVQRDSFRPRGTLTACSVRPAPRTYLVDYLIAIRAGDRNQGLAIHTLLLRRLSADEPLRINGSPSPVWILPGPPLERDGLVPSPVLARIGTRMETAAREEQPWIRRATVQSGQLDAPADQEGIVIEL